MPLDPEQVRFSGERIAAARLRTNTWLAELVAAAEAHGTPDPARVRRELMASSVPLTEGMAADTWAAARRAAAVLGVDAPLELFQAAGAENAAIHLVDSPVFLEIRGRLLALLDPDATVAVFGHELGHWLAHGPSSPDGPLGLVVGEVFHRGGPEHAVAAASALAMAREVTADRYGLLAVRNLDAALRLEVVTTTGLASTDLTWDTDAYLAQCRALVEQTVEDGDQARGLSHPEHGLRAWAVWLFSESDVYRELTGEGPGTRPIADVDAAISKALGASVDLTEPAVRLDPIPEVYECALAASTLVALADGELADDEAQAIESIFASRVPDWQRYLVWDNAMEAFYDTGAVVARSGASVQRSVFQVLVHVIAADGQILASEINMVCAIGDALGCGTLYRALLTPVLRSLGVETGDLDQAGKGIPFPAREDEAEAAVTAVLEGVVRRGGGFLTLRHLSRLLGVREVTEATRHQVAEFLRESGLTHDVDLADVGLDQRIDLVPTVEATAALAGAPPEPVEAEPARLALSDALTRLRDQLVSGDGHSPSVRLRRVRRGRSFDLHRLEELSVGHATRVLALVRSGRPARLVDGSEVGVHEGAADLSGELVSLERETLLRHEQTGARDLALGTPFLTGVFRGYLVRAPLVLHPVDLERTKGRGFRLVPRDGEDPVANQALVRLLFARKGVSFPDDLGEQLDAAAVDGVPALRELLGTHGIIARPEGDDLVPLRPRDEAFATWPDGRVVLEPAAVVGFFPQSSSDMIQDYDALLAVVRDPEVDLGARLGAAGPLLPAELRASLGIEDPDPAADVPLVPVLPADPAQLRVLAQARVARTLVVDGPPGTGKSQVIVNLVADALARGQRVAVVAEKRAALGVVAQRLSQLGLRHLLGVVHNARDDRRALYQQVVRRLGETALRDEEPADREQADRDLSEVEDELRTRREALAHTLGEDLPSLGQLHLLAASFAGEPLPDVDAVLTRLPHRRLRRLAELVSREALRADLHAPDAPWRADRPSLDGATPADLARVEDALVAAQETAAALDALREAQGVHERDVLPAAAALQRARATAPLRGDRLGRQAVHAWLHRGDTPGLSALARRVRTSWSQVDTWSPDMPERARFEGSPELETALALATERSGSLFRFLSLAWWRARKIIRTALAGQWPAARTAPFARPLFDRIRRRQLGSTAWADLEALLRTLGIEAVLVNAAGAREVADAVLEVEEVTDLLEERPVLDTDRARPADGPDVLDPELLALGIKDVFIDSAGAHEIADTVLNTQGVIELLKDRPVLEAAGAWPADILDGWDEVLAARTELLRAATAHRDALAPVREVLPSLPPTPTLAEVRAIHEAWTLDAHRVVASDRNLRGAEALYPRARELTHRLADAWPDAPATRWSDALEHGWALASLRVVERRTPGVRSLDRPTPWGELPEAEARLAERVQARAHLQLDHIQALRDRVPLLTEARPEHGRRRTPLQKAREQMLREASKKRYILSLRGFTRQFADVGLMDVLPVWLVSPETMAVLFPSHPVFDLVVVDEASQATVEKGFPALIRGHRAVVAGDEHQMPPSSFFALRTTDDEELGTADTVEADALTAESLLVLARERCPHASLRWHYRCAHEELIAFSNHAMYGGDLLTIPSTALPDTPPALRWESVPDGAYDKGANPIEAARVVDLVVELLARDPAPSVGVVTFNVQQRHVILDALDARAEADPDFGEHWSAATTHEKLDQRPFVKNLENVQGDERDVILFSLGHAPVPRRSGPLAGELYVPARFGPLGQAGGERRLNVAISRAKRECVIVSSFEPAQLTVAHAKHEGPRLLKAYLEYAWDLHRGRRLKAEKILEQVRSGGLGAIRSAATHSVLRAPSLASQLAVALRARGVDLDLDVGTSGFRVPLAVRSDSTYRLAVLTDEGDAVGDVVEVHLHHPAVLRDRGWDVVRVSAREWHQDPDAVLDRISPGAVSDHAPG